MECKCTVTLEGATLGGTHIMLSGTHSTCSPKCAHGTISHEQVRHLLRTTTSWSAGVEAERMYMRCTLYESAKFTVAS